MPLPSFFVIGAAKSGTTALYFYLRQHPELYLPLEQEPSWFAFADQSPQFTAPDDSTPAENVYAVTEREEYEALYAEARQGERLGDVSPAYLYWPEAPARMADLVPDARIAVILRHPVDRAYSAFMHAMREGREPIQDFRRALEAEPERIAENCGLMWRYRDFGRYAGQMKRWFRHFPRENFLIGTYEEFSRDPASFSRRVQSFVGVDGTFIPNTDTRHNASGVPRSRGAYNLLRSDSGLARLARVAAPIIGMDRMKRIQARLQGSVLERVPLDPTLRAELVDEWRPEIEEVADVVDLEIGHWVEAHDAGAV